jgi:hypothetical protein
VPTRPAQIKTPIETFDFCDAEIVVGLVCAVGTDYNPIRDSLASIFGKYGYNTRVVKISSLIPTLTDYELVDSPEIDRINSYMSAGNQGCRDSGRKDLWALAAIANINSARQKEKHGEHFFVQKPMERTAHLILSLKRPEEVAALRKIYGDGFFLVGVFATEKERLEHLLNLDAPKADALALIARDSQELDPHGQQTSSLLKNTDSLQL